MMLVTVFGKWEPEKAGDFQVDPTKGSKVYEMHKEMKFEGFLRDVCEDYNLEMNAVQIGYEVPQDILNELPTDTPPVYVTNDRQLANVIASSKGKEVVRLCVSEKNIRDGVDGTTNRLPETHRTFPSPSKQMKEDEETDPSLCSMSDDAEPETGKKTTRSILVGKRFKNKAELVGLLRSLTVTQRFDFRVDSSKSTVYTARCFVPGCKWRIRASTLTKPAESPEFVVRIYTDVHTCSAAARYIRHRQASPKCIGKMFLEKFNGGNDLKGIRPKHIRDIFNTHYDIDITYKKAHKALAYARDLVRGTPEQGYHELPAYLYRIEQANPGTITRLERDGENRFKYLFIALDASIKGFAFLRKVVVVDGTHLTCRYRGVMLLAAGKDANNNIFPIAFAVVDSENNDSWEWFFTQLRGVIGNDQNLAFISDRHKSIGVSLEKVFPGAARGICYRHLKENLKSKFKKKAMTSLVREAAYAYQQSEFQAHFTRIRAHNEDLADYLEKAKFELWASSHFPGERFGMMTSNIAESINSVLKEDRSFPVRKFVDSIRDLLSRWFVERREVAATLGSNFPQHVEETLRKVNRKQRGLKAHPIDKLRCQVTGGNYGECIVDLGKRSCTCKQWDVTKIPCEHAIRAAKFSKICVSTLVDGILSKDSYCSTYAGVINPEDRNLILPEEVKNTQCLPPEKPKPPGRPRISRYRTAIEKAKKHKRKKTKTSPSTPVRVKSTKQCASVAENKKTKRSTPSTARYSPRTPSPLMTIKTRSSNSPNTTTPRKKLKVEHTTPQKVTKKRSCNPPGTPTAKKKLKLEQSTSLSTTLQPIPKKRVQATPKKRVQVCGKCHRGGHNRTTCFK